MLQDGDSPQEAPTYKFIWPLNQVSLMRSFDKLNIYLLHHNVRGYQTWRVANYYEALTDNFPWSFNHVLLSGHVKS